VGQLLADKTRVFAYHVLAVRKGTTMERGVFEQVLTLFKGLPDDVARYSAWESITHLLIASGQRWEASDIKALVASIDDESLHHVWEYITKGLLSSRHSVEEMTKFLDDFTTRRRGPSPGPPRS